MLILNVKATS